MMDLLLGCFHLWTGLRAAELRDGAVEKVDLVVEVDDCFSPVSASVRPTFCPCVSLPSFVSLFRRATQLVTRAAALTVDSQPLIPILALGQLNHLPQAPTSERRLGKLLQLPAIRSLLRPSGLESGARAGVAVAA